jgi:hypothetical protein
MKNRTAKTSRPWLILALAATLAMCLFEYGTSLPLYFRFRGDAYVYSYIAKSFATLGDAFSYIGERTFGFPLFIFLIRKAVAVVHQEGWFSGVCWTLFLFHLAASFCFYRFFLRNRFLEANLPAPAAPAAAALIMGYPALVTYTATPLTDTFCVDLTLLAVALYWRSRESLRLSSATAAVLSGVLLGYSIVVRPSFWPAVLFLVGTCLVQAALNQERLRLLRVPLLMIVGVLVFIVPALTLGYRTYHTPCLQDPAFVKAAVPASLSSGLTSVRVFWSQKPSPDPLPGVKDPLLVAAFGKDQKVESLGALGKLLLKKPSIAPIYLGKKTIALFDVPHLNPYAVRVTPKWFPPLQRLFEIPAFCGFLSLIVLALLKVFRHPRNLPDLPLFAFAIGIYLTHVFLHIEGRYSFPLVPFSISALFLGFAEAKKAEWKIQWCWIIFLGLGAIVFLCQVLAWDSVPES